MKCSKYFAHVRFTQGKEKDYVLWIRMKLVMLIPYSVSVLLRGAASEKSEIEDANAISFAYILTHQKQVMSIHIPSSINMQCMQSQKSRAKGDFGLAYSFTIAKRTPRVSKFHSTPQSFTDLRKTSSHPWSFQLPQQCPFSYSPLRSPSLPPPTTVVKTSSAHQASHSRNRPYL